MQFLAISADQQQAVVGADAEHQHDEDAGRVGVHRVARVRVEVDEPAGGLVRERDDEDRDDRDQRRTVDRAEQHQHEQHGRRQQPRVELAEDLLEVREQSEVAGHVDLEAGAAGSDDAARLLAPVGDPVEVERDRHHGVRGLAVLRHQAGRAARRERHLGGSRDRDRLVDPAGVLGDLGLVGVRQPAGAPVDDQPQAGLAAREALLEELLDARRLGLGRQEAGGLVACDVGELGAERREHREGDDPEHDDQPLGAAAGDE
jgi:hypothetical protein